MKAFTAIELNHLYSNYEIHKLNGGTESFGDYVYALPKGWRKVANNKNK